MDTSFGRKNFGLAPEGWMKFKDFVSEYLDHLLNGHEKWTIENGGVKSVGSIDY